MNPTLTETSMYESMGWALRHRFYTDLSSENGVAFIRVYTVYVNAA